MADIQDVYGGIKSRVDDNPLTSGATSVTVQNEFTGLDVGVPGYLTIGDPQDALPGSNGEVPTSEFVRYEGFTRNGDGTSTFSSLTRGLRNSTAQEWPQGTVIGVSIPGALLQRLPEQQEDFSLGGNSITNLFAILSSAQSSPPSTPSNGDYYMDDGTNTEDGYAGLRQYTNGSWEDVGAGGGGSNAFSFFMG